MRGLNDGLLPIIGTMLMHSAPPAIITSASPTRMRSAAICTAVRPEAQKRLTVTPPTVCGRPASSARDARHVEALLAPRESRSRRWRPRSPSGRAPAPAVSALWIAATSRSSGRVLRKKPRPRLADRRAGGGDDVGVLNLLAHVVCSVQLRTGLPVCSMPMIRSCVFGWSSSAQKCLALQRHQVLLGHQRAGIDVAAAHHVGDQAGDVEVVRADEAAVAHVDELAP